MWRKGQPLAIVLGNNELWVPPYENYFGNRNAMLWAEWVDSNGSKGVEPPEWAKQMLERHRCLSSLRRRAPTEAAEMLGKRMVKSMVSKACSLSVRR